MKILIIGSINVDYSTYTKLLPLKGETITAYDYKVSAGGKGANQAVAAARLGADVSIIGNVGDDSAGKMMTSLLEKETINIKGLSTSIEKTGNAQITIQEDGANTIVVYPGANYTLDQSDIDDNISLIESADVVIMQLEIPIETIEYVTELEVMHDKTLILNPAPARKLSNKLLSKIDILTPNETELLYLTDEEDTLSGARKLIAMGVKEVVVTLGDQGAFYYNGDEAIKVASYSVDAIDTTAAGDSFNAALAVSLDLYDNYHDRLLFANRVGALTTLKKGAVTSLPTLHDVNEFAKNTLR